MEKKEYKMIKGHHIVHDGKKHQLYHHTSHGYGIFDSIGNFVRKAYDVG